MQKNNLGNQGCNFGTLFDSKMKLSRIKFGFFQIKFTFAAKTD